VPCHFVATRREQKQLCRMYLYLPERIPFFTHYITSSLAPLSPGESGTWSIAAYSRLSNTIRNVCAQ
jgi:hypothetical protein